MNLGFVLFGLNDPLMFADDPENERILLPVLLDEMGARDEFDRRVYRTNSLEGRYLKCRNNLYAEAHLTRGTWKRVIAVVLALPPDTDVEDIFTAIVGAFQDLLKPGDSLHGPLASIPKKRFLGRAVSRRAFEEFLKSRVGGMGKGGSSLSAADHVRFLQDRDVIDIPDDWRDLPLGQHLMWATFSDDEMHDRPFAALSADRIKMRCMLGLPWDDTPQLLFTYALPKDCPAHVPTVVEAYAGGTRKIFFRPAPLGAEAGQTEPRDDCEESMVRPEVVHRPVTLGALRASLGQI